MKCTELEAHWEDWREGKAPAALEEHLRECAHCRELAAELARTSSWLALLQQEPPEASPAFWPRLREQIEERERGRDFWAALGWAAGRAALGLTVLVLALTVGMVWEITRAEVAEFDGPQVYLQDAPGAVPLPTNGRLDRDQVVLTLVLQAEAQR
ncbi:MAG TPA: hypothetical protein VLB32_04775 [Candidatus Acidoferrales bacterium]|nr:hypothetical protein [Candidatus Acidoferrales bacterium]